MAEPLKTYVVQGRDPAADARIEVFLDACPSSFAQQTIGWRNVIAPIGPDESHFLVCQRREEIVGVLPAYAFQGSLGKILTSVPQAGPLGGIACSRDQAAGDIYAALLEAYIALARSLGCALASLITNPFSPDRELYERCVRPDYLLENKTQVLDLRVSMNDAGQPLNGSDNLVRNLRKARSSPLRVDETQSAENVDEWYELHAARHREIGATPLPRQLFTGALEEMVPRDKARFFFVRLSEGAGEMVAGGFYLHHGETIDAVMPSMRTEYAKLGPNYALATHTMRWARMRGLRYYNWEPSPPSGGVYRYKRQWGSKDITYHYLTWITGDVKPFTRSNPEEISRAYPWHYVLPFDQIGREPGSDESPSSREAAWNARFGENR